MSSAFRSLRAWVVGIAAAGLLATGLPLAAQDVTTGRITGRIVDEGGQPLPGVTVEGKNTGTGLTANSVSDANGAYRLINMPVGTYDVTAKLTGFQGASKKGINVTIGSAFTVDFSLKLASVSAELVVTAETPVVETTQTAAQTTVDSSAITSLPIVGRNFTDFVLLTPNAQRETSRGNLSLAGQRGIDTNITVDGVDFSNAFFGGVTGAAEGRAPISISQESVREFQVVQAGASAEFGRSGGGFVNVITKSGTNDFHGGVFGYLRPSSFVSKTRENPANPAQGNRELNESKKRNLGANFGGPIMKDRLFFFGSYEQQRQDTTFIRDASVAIAENIIRARFPNYPVSDPQFVQTQDGDVFFGRFDAQVNDKNRVTGRVNYTTYEGENGTNSFTNNANAQNGFEELTAYSIVANANSMFSGSMINDFNFQYTNEDIPRKDKGLGLPEIQTGISGTPRLGEVSFLPITAIQDRLTFSDALTFLKGNHVFKGGIEYNSTSMDQVFKGNWRGVYIFAAGGGRTVDQNFAAGNWDQYREFVGLNGRTADEAGQYNQKQKELAFYVQDQWFATPQLTVSLGLRYERQNNPDDPILDYRKLGGVHAATEALVQPDAEIPDATNQWSPRLSIAYTPGTSGKTVLRLSLGRYWSRFPALLTSQLYTANGVVGSQYAVTGAAANGPAAGVVAPGWGATFNPFQVQPLGNLPPGTRLATPGVFTINPDYQNPRTDQANMAVEHEVFGISFGLEGQYSKTYNLERISDLNLTASSNPAVDCPNLPVTSGVTCYGIKVGTANPRTNRPDLRYGRISVYSSDAYGRFWSATFKFRKNFANGLRFFGSVTRAEDKDSDSNERNFAGFFLEDVNSNALNYSFSDRDQKWRFLMNGNYDMKITSWLDGFVGLLFNYQTGRPFNPTTGTDFNLDGESTTDRPTIAGDHFERNSYRFPDRYTLDARIGLGFNIGPGRVSVFGECFNCTNTANRGISVTRWGTAQTPAANFGVSNTVTSFTRTYQIGARYDF